MFKRLKSFLESKVVHAHEPETGLPMAAPLKETLPPSQSAAPVPVKDAGEKTAPVPPSGAPAPEQPKAPLPKPQTPVPTKKTTLPVKTAPRVGPTAEQLCNISPNMTPEQVRQRLAFLYRRYNRASSSLNAGLRAEAESALDAIVVVREKYFGPV